MSISSISDTKAAHGTQKRELSNTSESSISQIVDIKSEIRTLGTCILGIRYTIMPRNLFAKK